MRKLILAAALSSCIVISCEKQASTPSIPASNSENSILAASVTFAANSPQTVYLTTGLNSLISGSFSVKDSIKIGYMKFPVTNNGCLIKPGSFKLYVNGGEYPATITYLNDTLEVALRPFMKVVNGNYTYDVKAKITGATGSTFNAKLTDINYYPNSVPTYGLPQLGDNLIMN